MTMRVSSWWFGVGSVVWLASLSHSAFVPLQHHHHRHNDVSAHTFETTRSSSNNNNNNNKCSPLFALTERQMQFWEDVEDGLKDVESYYEQQQQGSGIDSSIDRIYEFAKRAQSQVPPKGDAPGHDPSEEHVDGLTALPFWNTTSAADLFPWAEQLEAQSHIIQQEFQSKLSLSSSSSSSPQLFASDSVWQNQVMGTGWSAVRLQRLGVWNKDVCDEFPETYNLLKSLDIPLAVRGVCFARQAPNSGVQPHSDGRNFILTSHLGLQIPEGCWMKVGEKKSSWEVGKLLTLDTSFTHSTSNPSDEERHVLILDHWHPELTEAERAALEFIYDLRNKYESGLVPVRKPRALQQNEGGLGALWNQLTGG